MLYVLNLGFAAYAMWPNKVNDVANEDEGGSDTSDSKVARNWEMHSMKSPITSRAMPYTPRTQAFQTLDRQLPLRSQQNRYA